MTRSPYNILLKFLFCAFALIMLSACGGGTSAGDEGIEDGEAANCLVNCTNVTENVFECNDATHFCGEGETEALRSSCNLRSHDCGVDNTGTGLALALQRP